MSGLLAGQTSIVTGGSSGIGRAIARRFARQGSDVVIADRREDPREGGQPTVEAIESESESKARFVACDVTEVKDLRGVVEVAEKMGGVDVMVNNAGMFRVEDFLEVTEASYQRQMDVNVKGMFFGAQAAARKMVERGSGCIINLSSTAGLYGVGDYVAYSTSKGAVRLLTYALADRLGPQGIRVNAIHPGLVETDMSRHDAGVVGTEREQQFVQNVPLRRMGQPEDIAGAAVFLASDLAAYVTGESLVVDGGIFNTG